MAAVILLHTLALTRIDHYYDGGKFGQRDLQPSIHETTYSISTTHHAMHQLLKQSPNALQLAALLNVTEFVHGRMYKDYTERYRSEFLDNPDVALRQYLASSRSRLLGSGYWEVMARAAFVSAAKIFRRHRTVSTSNYGAFDK